jgi:hypothetical protein
MDDIIVVKSVLGFNLKADIRDKDGDLIKSGVRSSVIPDELPSTLNLRIPNRNFFTHFNDDLLKKIIDYRRLNGSL